MDSIELGKPPFIASAPDYNNYPENFQPSTSIDQTTLISPCRPFWDSPPNRSGSDASHGQPPPALICNSSPTHITNDANPSSESPWLTLMAAHMTSIHQGVLPVPALPVDRISPEPLDVGNLEDDLSAKLAQLRADRRKRYAHQFESSRDRVFRESCARIRGSAAIRERLLASSLPVASPKMEESTNPTLLPTPMPGSTAIVLEDEDMDHQPMEVDEESCNPTEEMLDYQEERSMLREARLLSRNRNLSRSLVDPSLQYRSSLEAATQCPMFVRNIPRMRKRRQKKVTKRREGEAHTSIAVEG